MKPDDVTDLVKDAGLRGRGGAGFSAGMKWSFLPKNHPGPVYLCVNADESEPGTFNNRILMEQDPHQLIEGIAIACHAIRSNTAYLYLRYEYGKSYRVLDAASGTFGVRLELPNPQRKIPAGVRCSVAFPDIVATGVRASVRSVQRTELHAMSRSVGRRA